MLIMLMVAPSQSYVVSPRTSVFARRFAGTKLASNPLDAFNEGMIEDKNAMGDDDVPMTKKEMRDAAKQMKAEMAALRAEAEALEEEKK